MKKYLVVFIFLVLFVCGVCSLFVERPKVKLITNEQGSFLEMAQGLVEELNKLPEEDLPNKKVDFYVANFTNNNISKIRNKNHYNILYLGSRRGFDIEKIQGFDKIFVSTPDLKAYFEEQGINTEFLQISWKDKGITADINNKDKWLYIGKNKNIENTLKHLGINYDKINSFALENELAISNKLDEIEGVIIENSIFYFENWNFSPLVLEIIARKIPIITNNKLLSRNLNDTLVYYLGIPFEEAIKVEFQDKMNEAYQLYKLIFSTDIVAKKISNILQNKEELYHETISLGYPYSLGLYTNGDYWFVRDLQLGLAKQKYTVHTYFYDSLFKNIGDVNIYFMGPEPFNNLKKSEAISLLYLTYLADFNDKYTPEYVSNAVDVVLVPSHRVVDKLRKEGCKSYYVPQWTNINKFYPDYDDSLKSEVLFIGNSFHYERKAAVIAVKNNFPITIYGSGWNEDYIKSGYVKDGYIDNRILRKYYSSAKINLNDHRPDMIENGFINNRTFDVTASGGFLISDYMPEIEEIYGDNIPMWKTEEELVELLNYYLDPAHEEERLEKAARARDITLKNFTSDIVAEKFDEIIKELKKEKEL